MDSLSNFFSHLDKLYAEGRHDEIEDFLRHTLSKHRICCGSHDTVFIAALNELGTYYRGIGHYDESATAFEEAGHDILSYGQKDTLDYATNRINLAGTLRLQKKYDQALSLYRESLNIYQRLEGKQSYHYAATLNNIALVYIDIAHYDKALTMAKKSLGIIQKFPEDLEEQAISHINCSTAYYHLDQKAAAIEEAQEALNLYAKISKKGIHYSNALNLQAVLAMDAGEYQLAYETFLKSANYIKTFLGKNEDYNKAMTNANTAAAAMEHKKSKKSHLPSTAKAPDREKTPGFGLTLCNDYYEEIGKPALQSQFTDVWDRIAIGLVGEGSDCLGFDDELSRDHDWGPSFCMWLTNEDYATFGQALQKAYLALPHEFRGYQRQETQSGKGRVGVWRISDFYRHFIGLSKAPETLSEWIRIPESFLAKATNGHVFTDPLGKFSTIRQILLAFYPEDVRIKKIAYYACQMAQSGQYNYKRSLDRRNPTTAACARYEFIKAAIAMVYLLNKKYMPFYKWAHHGLQYLPTLSDMYGKITTLITTTDTAIAIALIEEICDDIRKEWQHQDLAVGTDSFLLSYTPKLISHIQNDGLRQLPAWQLY
ncbi:DUF4037 domain-containing protein [Megasphaera sp.]|uniref:DUF4037 domain-containing protein n=1 Tax=Megasphaera TaxID=906 RepID=UPI001D690359|nr:DUF4037 domain-containing protein [Megasphaera sp.]MBS6791088.1 DUF4037 domain-containing protein [Megasphaera sp.]